MSNKPRIISVVISEEENARLERLRAALQRKNGILWPITQIVRLALKVLAAKEKVK